jgi:hypothetical protein
MVKISFQPTDSDDLDAILNDLANAAKERGNDIRLRLQPQLYHPNSKGYKAWRGVSWTLEIEDLAELEASRRALKHFFELLERYGGEGLADWLEDYIKQLPEERPEPETADAVGTPE